jgi:uncharacterized protein YkwD
VAARQPSSSEPAVTPDLPIVEHAILEMSNAFRQQQGRDAVRRNKTLDQAARDFARYLARTTKFSHTADGRRPADRAQAAGYRYCRVAENLALNMDSRGFETRDLAHQAVEGWKESPPHRKAMLDPFVTEIGIGVAKAPDEQRYLSVQLFGRPRALQYQFTIRNRSRQAVEYTHGGARHRLGPGAEVQHTACTPGELDLENVTPAGRAAGTAASYQTRDGDLFVVTPRDGNLVVEYRPRTE